MQNKILVTPAKLVSMDTTRWECALYCPDKKSILGFIYGDTEHEAKERANLIVDAFNNAGLGPFLP